MNRLCLGFTLLMLSSALPSRVHAHAGHDDAPGTGTTAIASGHVLTALSDRFEVVLKNDSLRPGLKTTLEVYLSEFRSNAPVAGAQVALSLRSGAQELWKGEASPTPRAGVYSTPFQAPSDTGSFTVLVTITSAGTAERFALSGLEVSSAQKGHGDPVRQKPNWIHVLFRKREP